MMSDQYGDRRLIQNNPILYNIHKTVCFLKRESSQHNQKPNAEFKHDYIGQAIQINENSKSSSRSVKNNTTRSSSCRMRPPLQEEICEKLLSQIKKLEHKIKILEGQSSILASKHSRQQSSEIQQQSETSEEQQPKRLRRQFTTEVRLQRNQDKNGSYTGQTVMARMKVAGNYSVGLRQKDPSIKVKAQGRQERNIPYKYNKTKQQVDQGYEYFAGSILQNRPLQNTHQPKIVPIKCDAFREYYNIQSSVEPTQPPDKAVGTFYKSRKPSLDNSKSLQSLNTRCVGVFRGTNKQSGFGDCGTNRSSTPESSIRQEPRQSRSIRMLSQENLLNENSLSQIINRFRPTERLNKTSKSKFGRIQR